MRIAPASAFRRRMGGPPLQDIPDPESVLGKVYALFQSKRAVPISNKEINKLLGDKKSGRTLIDLVDYYGLDIRSVPDCHHKCLVGEFFGDEYRDYLAEKIK